MGTIPFTLRLDDKLKRDLEIEAQLEDRSASYLATNAIRLMLQASAERRLLIEKAIAEADKGEFVSQSAVNDWFSKLGSEDEMPTPTADIKPT
jgi:predicted transcriptional regulator